MSLTMKQGHALQKYLYVVFLNSNVFLNPKSRALHTMIYIIWVVQTDAAMVVRPRIVGGSQRLISLPHAINNARSKWSELTLWRQGNHRHNNNNIIIWIVSRWSCTDPCILADPPVLPEFFVLLWIWIESSPAGSIDALTSHIHSICTVN